MGGTTTAGGVTGEQQRRLLCLLTTACSPNRLQAVSALSPIVLWLACASACVFMCEFWFKRQNAQCVVACGPHCLFTKPGRCAE